MLAVPEVVESTAEGVVQAEFPERGFTEQRWRAPPRSRYGTQFDPAVARKSTRVRDHC